MAFWKKSGDPWDRKPERRQASWYENDAPAEERPPEAGHPAEASGEDRPTPEERIRRIIEGPQREPFVPEKCPWCGGETRAAYLYAKGFVKWSYELPSGWESDYEILDDINGLWGPCYKQGSYCESCEKMTLNVKKPRPLFCDDQPSFADYARQWKEMEEREKEEERRKKRGD